MFQGYIILRFHTIKKIGIIVHGYGMKFGCRNNF